MKKHTYFFTIASVLFVLFSGAGVKAANIGDTVNFNVDQNFEASGKSQIQAELIKISSGFYFYVDRNWWESQDTAKKNEITVNLDDISSEFNTNIYPKLTSAFGSEWRPGIDNDNRITLLFHAMNEGQAGYFRSMDEYLKLQVPASNEREMLYLSLGHINDGQLKMFIAHEFTHLIEFNQKDRLQGVQEETWLNEGRADFASTILGYDNSYQASNLQKRVGDFLNSPFDSLTEWHETKYDYAVVNVFMHYLVDHYGTVILSDSLHSKSVGIDSIDEALAKNGFKEDFSQIFTNWTIAIAINDCGKDLTYCYFNKNLGNLRISPTLNFLPLSGNSSLSVTNVIKNWSANWQKIIGGHGDLQLQFESVPSVDFQVPYILFDKNNDYTVHFLDIDKNGKAQINISDFGINYTSLVIIPSLKARFSGFDTLELSYPYTFTASITGNVSGDNPTLIQKLLAQIESLRQQIADLLAGQDNPITACTSFNNNLYAGVSNKAEVTCLQQFLKSQGQDIYPEGLVTGYFGPLTKSAVVRFQKKYGIIQTGFVGVLTRTKINTLLP